MTGPGLYFAVCAVLTSAIQFGVTTGRTSLAAVLGTVALTAAVNPRRWRIGSAGEVLLLLAFGVGGMLLQGVDPNAMGQASAPLRSAMFIFAFTGLGAAALRLHLERPEGGLSATLASAGIVFLACGTVRTGLWLPRVFAIHLLLSLVALSLDAWQRGSAPAPWRLRGRHAWVSIGLLVAIPVAMWAWASTGPRLIRSGTSYVLDQFGPTHGVGFHDGPISLHALDGLLDSDEVVMRIEGAAPSHLRGNVYVGYTRGRWQPPSRADVSDSAPAVLGESLSTGRFSSIEYAAGEGDRFFLPLGAEFQGLEPDAATVDRWRIVRSQDGTPETARITWAAGAGESMAMPSEEDLLVPQELREPLLEVADGLAGTNRDSQAAWARSLAHSLSSQFTYSISFREVFARAQRARPRADPVLVFLQDVREGHCEYYASALALMLRAGGVPARMVTGYRVAERNPIGDYAIVRERHAHAWVEAFLPVEGWVTLDGTPMASAGHAGLTETPRMTAVLDWLVREVKRRGQQVLLVLLVVGLATVQVVRLWRGHKAKATPDGSAQRRVSIALRRLLGRLASEGFDRKGAESLESLARRLRDGFAPSPPTEATASPRVPAAETLALLEAADLLDRYAAHRYGDVGDWDLLAVELSAWPAAGCEDVDAAASQSERRA